LFLAQKINRVFRDTLVEMDRILTVTGIEDRMIVQHLKSFAEAHPEKPQL